jgi:hypothetical protein
MAEEPTEHDGAPDGDVAPDGEPDRVPTFTHLPAWVAVVFYLLCLGLIPQTVRLSSSLKEIALANHWRTVWVGLDIAEAVVFLLTAWFLFRQSILVAVTASMAAAMLWLDAWFDVLTSVR